MRTFALQRTLVPLLLAGLASVPAQAATIDLGGDAKFSIGAGMKLSARAVENGAPNGTDYSNDIIVNSTRIYTSGYVMKGLGATLNLERDGSGNTPDGMRMLDAYVQYEPMPEFNVWLGRMLPAVDRYNLDGPYYLNVFDFPFVQMYPAIFAGRDNGVQVWGKLMSDKLVYAAGAFTGHNNVAGGSNQSDNLLYNWRVSYAFWDAEPAPAYYTASTYYGDADILTVGFAGMFQKDGVGVAGAKDDYLGMSIDALMEKKLGNGGLVTLEGTYWKYDLGGTPDCNGDPGVITPACPAGNNVGGLVEGKAWLTTALYKIPGKIGIGEIQPFVRYQNFERKLSNSTIDAYDVGVNYIIKGHNAKFSLYFNQTDDDLAPEPIDMYVFGVQLQI